MIWILISMFKPMKQEIKNHQIHKNQNNLRRLLESLDNMHRMLSHSTTHTLVKRLFKMWGQWIGLNSWNNEINIPVTYGNRNKHLIRW